MSKIVSPLLSLALIAAGCSSDKGEKETALFEKTAAEKPLVAFVPMIDRSQSGLTWSVSEELTRSVQEKLLQRESLYLVDSEKVQSVVKKLKENQDPFGADVSWIKKAFFQDEFVVFLELVEHDEVPAYASKDADLQSAPADLNMAVRLRVFDLRGNEPRVVLQELIRDAHHIPRQFTKANFLQVPWGHEMFDISPLGMAHTQLTKELASRVEDYILMAAHQ